MEEKKPEESKAEESKEAAPPQEIVLRVFMHCEGCAKKVRRCLKGFEGRKIFLQFFFFFVFFFKIDFWVFVGFDFDVLVLCF